jgi:hypothetical protein
MPTGIAFMNLWPLSKPKLMKPIVEHPSPASDAEPVLCDVVRGKDFGCV